MISRYGRLDRFLLKHTGASLRELKAVLAAGRVQVDGNTVRHADRRVGPFNTVVLDGQVMQSAAHPCYLMLHKPAGVVSATRDDRHRTVMDLLLETAWAKAVPGLHVAGRLDATSTGLMLLTNDGQWSRALCEPQRMIRKRYRVRLRDPLGAGAVEAFAAGMYFAHEDITTRPATLLPISDHEAEVVLVEGRYHQIRRMFAHLGNRVTALHRFAIGPWQLPPDLAPGQARALSDPHAFTASQNSDVREANLTHG